jgi:hypothetical protein
MIWSAAMRLTSVSSGRIDPTDSRALPGRSPRARSVLVGIHSVGAVGSAPGITQRSPGIGPVVRRCLTPTANNTFFDQLAVNDSTGSTATPTSPSPRRAATPDRRSAPGSRRTGALSAVGRYEVTSLYYRPIPAFHRRLRSHHRRLRDRLVASLVFASVFFSNLTRPSDRSSPSSPSWPATWPARSAASCSALRRPARPQEDAADHHGDHGCGEDAHRRAADLRADGIWAPILLVVLRVVGGADHYCTAEQSHFESGGAPSRSSTGSRSG